MAMHSNIASKANEEQFTEKNVIGHGKDERLSFAQPPTKSINSYYRSIAIKYMEKYFYWIVHNINDIRLLHRINIG